MDTLSSVMSLGLAVKKLAAFNFYVCKQRSWWTLSHLLYLNEVLIFHAKKPKKYCCHPGLLPPFCTPMTFLRNYLLLMLNAMHSLYGFQKVGDIAYIYTFILPSEVHTTCFNEAKDILNSKFEYMRTYERIKMQH